MHKIDRDKLREDLSAPMTVTATNPAYTESGEVEYQYGIKPSILQAAENWLEISDPDSIEEFSDGYHTFNELYEHRHILFLALMAFNCANSWKSKLHHDGTMFDGWFIAGINTPQGQATYHLPLRLWDSCNSNEVAKAPEWDGHTSNDVLTRIMALKAMIAKAGE